MIRNIVWIVAILIAVAAIALGWVYSGQYNIAADAPHWDVTKRVLATLRDRSIEVRAGDLTVPNLADPALIALGGEHYAAMCSGCHLAPEKGDTAMRQGLYPKPPDLTEPRNRSPAETFWIVKHGLKMSGMPAWGVTHDDESLWGLVAFLRELPALDAAGYAALTAAPAGGQDGHSGHNHNSAGDESDGSPQGSTMDNAADDGHAHQHSADP